MIIRSILDNDFYKFTMQNAVMKHFPDAQVEYRFINRGAHEFPAGFDQVLQTHVENLSHLSLTKEEVRFLRINCPYLDAVYIDFLKGYQYDPSEVEIRQEGSNLEVVIKGPWYRTILWEVVILSLISELYYQETEKEGWSMDKIRDEARQKIEHYRKRKLFIAEFGTRRRHSLAVHDGVVKTLKEYGGEYFNGTSNVHLAQKYDLKPIGTHAHEWFMFHAARYGFKMSNTMALEHWVDVYRGDLGIALSDTYTSEVFFESFDKKFSKLFDGVRHDSGDPVEFAKQTIAHYERMKIDPRSKTIVFSDDLNPERVDRIADYCRGKIGMSFGIGTNFTNDTGLPPMNIVIKMTGAKPFNRGWIPTIKLSDEPGKHSGDQQMIELAKTLIELQY